MIPKIIDRLRSGAWEQVGNGAENRVSARPEHLAASQLRALPWGGHAWRKLLISRAAATSPRRFPADARHSRGSGYPLDRGAQGGLDLRCQLAVSALPPPGRATRAEPRPPGPRAGGGRSVGSTTRPLPAPQNLPQGLAWITSGSSSRLADQHVYSRLGKTRWFAIFVVNRRARDAPTASNSSVKRTHAPLTA